MYLRDGRDAADTLHVHSMLCTDPEPCPTTGGVTAHVCVTNWAGRADPARAAVPAELGTEPAPLEMPPGTSSSTLGFRRWKMSLKNLLTCEILLMLFPESPSKKVKVEVRKPLLRLHMQSHLCPSCINIH